MTRRTTILIGAVLLFSIAWLLFLYLPVGREQARLTNEINSAETQLRQYESTLAQLPAFLAAKADLKSKLALANSNLYAKEDLVKLFDELKHQAEVRSLRVVEITPPVEELLELNKTLPTEGKPLVLNLNLVIRGNYIDFGRFVQSLEEAPYFRSVRGCVISHLEDGSGQVIYSLGFEALLGMTNGDAS